jgi:hypothetical protein
MAKKLQTHMCISHVRVGVEFGNMGSDFPHSIDIQRFLEGRKAVINLSLLTEETPQKIRSLENVTEFKALFTFVKKKANVDPAATSASLDLVAVREKSTVSASGNADVPLCKCVRFVTENHFNARLNAIKDTCKGTLEVICSDIAESAPKGEFFELNFLHNSIMGINPMKAVLLDSYSRYTVTFGGYVSKKDRGAASGAADATRKSCKKSKSAATDAANPKAKSTPPVKLRTSEQLSTFMAERKKQRKTPCNDFHTVLETTLFLSSAEKMFSDRVAYAMELRAILKNYEHLNSERACLFKHIIPIIVFYL